MSADEKPQRTLEFGFDTEPPTDAKLKQVMGTRYLGWKRTEPPADEQKIGMKWGIVVTIPHDAFAKWHVESLCALLTNGLNFPKTTRFGIRDSQEH